MARHFESNHGLSGRSFDWTGYSVLVAHRCRPCSYLVSFRSFRLLDGLPEQAVRAPSVTVWNQSFPSPRQIANQGYELCLPGSSGYSARGPLSPLQWLA